MLLLAPSASPTCCARASKWSEAAIEQFLWQTAAQRIQQLASAREPILLLWDESVVEKPESAHAEGLCCVRSSHARRLLRIKPGFYQPPTTRPIFVPGIDWLCLLVIGMSGAPAVAAMRWFTTRGDAAQEPKQVRRDMLARCANEPWFCDVLHIFDRGYCGSPWLAQLASTGARFVVRWTKHYKLVGGIDGAKEACLADHARQTLTRHTADSRHQSQAGAHDGGVLDACGTSRLAWKEALAGGGALWKSRS